MVAAAAQLISPSNQQDSEDVKTDLGRAVITMETSFLGKLAAFSGLGDRTETVVNESTAKAASAVHCCESMVELIKTRHETFQAALTDSSEELFAKIQAYSSKKAIMLPVSRPVDNIKALQSIKADVAKLFEASDLQDLEARSKRIGGALSTLHQLQQSVVIACKDLDKAVARKHAQEQKAEKDKQKQEEAKRHAEERKSLGPGVRRQRVPAVGAPNVGFFDGKWRDYCSPVQAHAHTHTLP